MYKRLGLDIGVPLGPFSRFIFGIRWDYDQIGGTINLGAVITN